MSAIEMLEAQHRDCEQLFDEMAEASGQDRRDIFEEIADQLTIHAAIEERHFYPAVQSRDTEVLLHTAVDDHTAIKRLVAEILAMDAGDVSFDDKVRVLQEQVERHVEEEEEELFPLARKLLSASELDDVEEQMTATQEELLEEGDAMETIVSDAGRDVHA